MSGRLLDFKSYIGGSDNVITLEMFPSTQKSYTYNYAVDVSSYTFEADYQTLVLDTVSYDRATGDPNFTDTNVVGFFANAEISGGNIDTSDASSGLIYFTIPKNRYTGSITPSARTNVPATVVSFKWTDTVENTTNSHRYLILERWESDVAPGDPTLDAAFTKLGVGAINAISVSPSGADATRANANATYSNVSGLSSENGQNASFQIIIEEDGSPNVNITSRGTGFVTGETIEILDSSIGASGADNLTITVSSTL
jgi:hypothetical protein